MYRPRIILSSTWLVDRELGKAREMRPSILGGLRLARCCNVVSERAEGLQARVSRFLARQDASSKWLCIIQVLSIVTCDRDFCDRVLRLPTISKRLSQDGIDDAGAHLQHAAGKRMSAQPGR